MAKDVQDGTKTERPMKKIPVLYKEELAPLDFKWDGKGWSSDKTAVANERKNDIPYIDPTSNHKATRIGVPKRESGLDSRLIDFSKSAENIKDLNNPVTDMIDAPATGAMKAFSFLGMPDKDALQLAMSRLAMNGDRRADAIMKLSPKARDELTTAMYRQIETSPRGMNTRVATGVGYMSPNRSTGNVRKVNIGKDGEGMYYDTAPFHEWYHAYDFLAGKLNDMHKAGAKAGVYGQRVSRSAKDDGAEIRALLDKIPVVQHANEHFAKFKKKDLKVDDLVDFLMQEIQKSDTYGELTQPQIRSMAYKLSDAITLRDKKYGGVWQSESGMALGGVNTAHGQHKASYNKDFKKYGENAEAMEGGAELNEMASKNAWLEHQGVKNEDLYPDHLPYTPEEELALANDLRQSQYYDASFKVPTFKMRPTGSHADKFFEKEAKYMAENGGDHSPDWYSAVKEGWMGDRYGKYDEDALNGALNSWAKKNNVNLSRNETFKLQSLLDAWEEPMTSKDEKNSILSALIDDYVDYNQNGRWFVNQLNAGDLYSFSKLPRDNRWDILELVGNGHDIRFTGKEWVDLSDMARQVQFR